MNGRPKTFERALVIGLDGATLDVLRPLADAGVMPHVARLLARGAVAALASTAPPVTPVAWTTFQTGCDPHEHGIFDFRYYDHVSGRILMNQSGRIARPTLLDAVAASGGEVVSLNLPMTFPAPPGVPGIVVGGIDSPSIEAAMAPYPDFERRLLGRTARLSLATIWKTCPRTFDELSHGVAQTEAAFRSRATAAKLADEMTDWRLMIVHFQTLDALQHRCWHLLGIDPWCTGERAWIEKVHQALRTLDRCVGELCEMADRRRSAIAIVSDHGFGPFEAKVSLPRLLEANGLSTPAGGFGGLGYRFSRTTWKLRKWAHRQVRLGKGVSRLHRPLEVMLPVDRRRTTAVAVHGSLAAMVYVNSPVRFGDGPIATGVQFEQATADIIAAFRDARDPRTELPLFGDVFSTRARFDADPVAHRWPDVIAIPRPGWHTKHKFDRDRRLVRDDPEMMGTHRMDGVLAFDLPPVRKGMFAGQGGKARGAPAKGARLCDVAPTLLALLGIAPLAPMTGRVLDNLVEVQEAVGPTLARMSAHLPRPHVDFAADQCRVERRLQELGYID